MDGSDGILGRILIHGEQEESPAGLPFQLLKGAKGLRGRGGIAFDEPACGELILVQSQDVPAIS
jgi:hypothetical protein